MGEVLAVMSRLLSRALAVLSLPIALTACSVGNDTESFGVALQEIIIEEARTRTVRQSEAASPAALTRAQIAAFEEPMLRAEVPSYRINSLLYLAEERPPLQIWLSGDNASLAFRSGMVIRSQNVGIDLYSVEAPRMIAVLEGREGPGPARRVHRALNGANEVVAIEFTCTISDLGSTKVTIVGLSYPTRHLREACSSPTENFVNDYWQQGRTMWKSRQWFGEQIGYVTLERLAP